MGQTTNEAFFTALNATLSEWSGATTRVMEGARDELLRACGLPAGEHG